MRLALPTIFLLAASAQASAQPTITSSSLPNAGLTANFQAQLSSMVLSPGSAGANVTWNFGSFSGGSASTISYAACPGAPGCSNFPGSDLVGVDNNGGASYFSVLNGTQAIAGIVPPSGGSTVYTNPEDYIRTPMTYNSTFTDAFAATISGSTPSYRLGSATNLVDGYGTLITPAGTYNNVLRVKHTSAYRDSVAGVGIIVNFSETAYLWYSPSIRQQLFAIASTTYTPLGGGGGTINSAGYRTGVTASVEDAATQSFFQLSPNPASDRLALRWDATTEATATLTDLTGRTIAQQAGRGGVSFAVDALPRGLYMLRVQDGSGAVHGQKVMLR